MVNFLSELADVCRGVGIHDKAIDQLGKELLKRYREKHRHYHTVEHIEAVLGHLETLEAATTTTRFTAFFHDMVYDPKLSNNEARSAALGRALLQTSRVPQADDVAAIVLATAAHKLTDGLPQDAAAFLDADLAILGQEPRVYHAYTHAIRAEYNHMSTHDFRTGRAAVLRGFANRPTLFFTAPGQELWEGQARDNIARELTTLPPEQACP